MKTTCTTSDAYLLASGMVAIGAWRLMDFKLGGASGRERFFLRWEKEEMASCLPPVGAPPCDISRSSVSDFLDLVDLVSNLAITGQSEFEEFEVSELSNSRATQVGCLWLRGPVDEWMLGEAIKVSGDHKPWRILEIIDGSVKMVFDDRSNHYEFA